MDWNDLFVKAMLIVVAVTMVVVGSGVWWTGFVVALPMVLIFLIAGMVKANRATSDHRR